MSRLTVGHQIGNQLPGHGRQCQADVLVPYRIEARSRPSIGVSKMRESA